jgi:hypothetical protein
MKQMPIRKQIRIQRLQNKNCMVGKTFNPSGITSEQIIIRENNFVHEMKLKTLPERQRYWNENEKIRLNWKYSWPWEWCAFERNFIYNGIVI